MGETELSGKDATSGILFFIFVVIVLGLIGFGLRSIWTNTVGHGCSSNEYYEQGYCYEK